VVKYAEPNVLPRTTNDTVGRKGCTEEKSVVLTSSKHLTVLPSYETIRLRSHEKPYHSGTFQNALLVKCAKQVNFYIPFAQVTSILFEVIFFTCNYLSKPHQPLAYPQQ
jgi:hypothetical protein